MEVVRGLADRECQQLGQPRAGPGGEFGMGVDPSPDRGPAQRHRQQLVTRRLDAADRLLDLAGIALELLSKADRRGVLEVRPPGLDDGPELLGLRGEGLLELDERGDEDLLDRHRGAELERRRDVVVRALAPVDVVVRVDPAALPKASRRQTGHDLVHVRVRGGARARLVDVDRELCVVIAVGDGRGRVGDRRGDLRREQAELGVRLGRGQLDERQRADEASREPLSGDREVQHGSLGRGAVERIRGDGHLTHGVALRARRGALVRHASIVPSDGPDGRCT